MPRAEVLGRELVTHKPFQERVHVFRPHLVPAAAVAVREEPAPAAGREQLGGDAPKRAAAHLELVEPAALALKGERDAGPAVSDT